MSDECIPKIEDLCPFHDMGKEFGECVCKKEMGTYAANGGQPSARTGSSGNARALGDESC